MNCDLHEAELALRMVCDTNIRLAVVSETTKWSPDCVVGARVRDARYGWRGNSPLDFRLLTRAHNSELLTQMDIARAIINHHGVGVVCRVLDIELGGGV